MVENGNVPDKKTVKHSHKKFDGKLRLVLIILSSLIIIGGGVFAYVLYDRHAATAAVDQAENVVKNDPLLSLRDFSNRELAVSYLSKYKRGGAEEAQSLYAVALQDVRGGVSEYGLLVDYYRIAAHAGDGQGAVSAGERLYELYPDVDHTMMLARAYGMSGDQSKQVEYLEKVVTLDPLPEVLSVVQGELNEAKKGNEE